MGEAKRRNREGAQVAFGLQQRIERGEFGAEPTRATHWLIVLDRSARGRGLLTALRQGGQFVGLEPLLEGEAFRFWDASTLFEFVLLCSGEGSADRRTLLAADAGKLLRQAVPTALGRTAKGTPVPGLVAAVDEANQARLQPGIEQVLRG